MKLFYVTELKCGYVPEGLASTHLHWQFLCPDDEPRFLLVYEEVRRSELRNVVEGWGEG